MIQMLILGLVLTWSVRAQESRLGSYRVAMEHTETATHAGQFSSVRYTVADKSGKQLYMVGKKVPFDVGFPAPTVFESGRLLLVDSFHGELEFYDRTGAFSRKVVPLKDAKPNHERIIVVSPHDTLVSFLISEPGRRSCLLLVGTDRGKIVLELDIEGENASGIQFSPDAKRIAVSSYRWRQDELSASTHFVTRGGKRLGSVSIGFTKGLFSNDGADFFCLTNRSISLVNVATLSVRWSHALPADRLILDATWLGDTLAVLSSNTPVLTNGQWRYRQARVEVISHSGEVRLLQEFSSEEFKSARLRQVGREVQLELDGALHPLPAR